jgi:diaminobutyrate-2-oxoglutarate transaminase
MMRGLHSEDPKLIHAIASAAFKHGVVIETSGSKDDVLKILAPLTISDELLREGLLTIESCVAQELGVSSRKKENVLPLKSAGRSS